MIIQLDEGELFTNSNEGCPVLWLWVYIRRSHKLLLDLLIWVPSPQWRTKKQNKSAEFYHWKRAISAKWVQGIQSHSLAERVYSVKSHPSAWVYTIQWLHCTHLARNRSIFIQRYQDIMKIILNSRIHNYLPPSSPLPIQKYVVYSHYI